MIEDEEQAEEVTRRIEHAVTEIHEFVQDVVIVATRRNEDGTTELFSNFRGTTLACESAINSWIERRKYERLLDFMREKGLITEDE